MRVQTNTFKNAFGKGLLILTATDISDELKAQSQIMQAIIHGEETERKRLSQDLHDSLIQQLSAAKFHINSTLAIVKNKKIKPSLNVSDKILKDAIKEVRTISFNLMPPMLQEFGLLKSITAFATKYKRDSKFEIVKNSPLPKISHELQLELYRISQELISNAIKHGEANEIKMFISYQNNSLKIIFSDNGKGFDIKKRSNGMGLRNIEGRIKSRNGATKITSQISIGTTIKILIPINKHIWASFNL